MEFTPRTVRYFTLLNAIDQAVIATDVRGNIAYWNGAAEELYGWSADEVRGRNIIDVTPAEISRAQGAEIMATISAGEIWSGVFAVHDRSGREFQAAVTDLPIVESGHVVGVIGVSKEEQSASPLPMLLSEFANAIGQLWPAQLELVIGRGLDAATSTVGDPHLLHLLALIVMRETEAFDRGDRLRLTLSRPARGVLDQFGVTIPAARCAHICLTQAQNSNLADAMRTTVGSKYAAILVGRAGGRLFVDATSGGVSTHLFLPTGI